jgi:hypothetical protein
MIFSPILILVVAMIVGGLIGLAKFLFVGEVNGLVQIGAPIVGALAGVFAAHSAANRWFPNYNSRVVFVWIFALCCVSLLYDILYYNFNFDGLVSISQTIAVAIIAYRFFWVASTPP